jgi:exonuclease SbcC
MLEHLYPNGDGLAVFDDPFTDMDPKRVEESCKLVQKFAENNQVIFITCDEKYQNFFKGNVIHVMK